MSAAAPATRPATVPTLRQISAAGFARAISDLENPAELQGTLAALAGFPPAYLARILPELPWAGMRALWQSRDPCVLPHLRCASLDESLRREENLVRQRFATNRAHKTLRDPTVGLVDVFGEHLGMPNKDMFRLRQWGSDDFYARRKVGATAEGAISSSSTDGGESKGECPPPSSSSSSHHPVPAQDATAAPPAAKKLILCAEGNVPSRTRLGEPSIVPSVEAFRTNFSAFTGGALEGLDWNGVLAAGGACAACLLPLPAEGTPARVFFSPTPPPRGGRRAEKLPAQFMQRSSSAKSRDVDLFLVGLASEEAAREKILHVYDVIVQNCILPPLVVVNGHALTFYRAFPLRSIQVVSRLYVSPAEVLHGFDVDSCCVGWDGTRVLCPPRTIRAFNMRCNVVDLTRRSLSYEHRLFKYAKREFAIAVNGISREEISPRIYDRALYERKRPEGLEALLLSENSFQEYLHPPCGCAKTVHDSFSRNWSDDKRCRGGCFNTRGVQMGRLHCSLFHNSALYTPERPIKMRTVRMHFAGSTGWWGNMTYPDRNYELLRNLVGPGTREENIALARETRACHGTSRRKRFEDTLDKGPGPGTQDYEFIVLPWDANTSEEQVSEYLSNLNSQHEMQLDELREGQQEGWGDISEGRIDSEAPQLGFSFDPSKVLGQMTWVKHDCGRQLLTGSFHPLDNELWDYTARLAPGAHQFYQISIKAVGAVAEGVTANDLAKSSKAMRKLLLAAGDVSEGGWCQWFLKNKGWSDNQTVPQWWKPNLVLRSAALAPEVEYLEKALATMQPPALHEFSFEPYTIVVGDRTTHQGADAGVPTRSLAALMAMPTLVRCDYCNTELLVPNRCKGCQKVSFCGRDCLTKGWKTHRKVCDGWKRRKKKK